MPDLVMPVHRGSNPIETFLGRELPSGNNYPFLLSSRGETLVAEGIRQHVDAPSVDALPDAMREYFAASEGSLAVGLLPFRRDRKPYLFEPRAVHRYTADPPAPQLPHRRPVGRCSAAEEPSREDYQRMVEQALRMMSDSTGLQKVVLSRVLRLRGETPIDIGLLLRRLALDRNAATFAVTLPSGPHEAPATLVGATPELLLEKRGTRFSSVPLAGSARRRAIASEDRAAAEALLHSEKDLREHAEVVESVVEALAPWCRNVYAAPKPSAVPTATMWHLGTRIEGEVRDDAVTSLHLAAALHPTAAVCGNPRERAAAAIEALEPFDRGFFTGAVGWCDSAGDGQWMVTIRCAEISGSSARLYAGAGIVTGSDPEAEAAETSAKFETLLRALGVDETGRFLDEAAA